MRGERNVTSHVHLRRVHILLRVHQLPQLIAGDALGRVHFLRLEEPNVKN